MKDKEMNSVHDFYKSLFINRGYKKEERYSIEECLKAYNYGIPNYYTPMVSEKDKDKEEDKRLKEKGLLKKKVPDAIDFQKAMVKDGILNRIKSVIKLEEKVYGICDKLKKDYSLIHLIIKGEEGKEVKPKEYNELINKINENLGNNEYFSKRWISHVYGIEIGEKKGKWHMHLMVFCLLDYEVENVFEMRIEMGNWILNCVYWIYQMLGGGYIDRGIREYHISTARMRYPERCYVNRDNLSSRINGILYLTYTCKLDKYTKKKMKEDRLRLFGVGINNRYRQLTVINEREKDSVWIEKTAYLHKDMDQGERYRLKTIIDMLNLSISYSKETETGLYLCKTMVEIPKLTIEHVKEGIMAFNLASMRSLPIVDSQVGYIYQIRKQDNGHLLEIMFVLNDYDGRTMSGVHALNNQLEKVYYRHRNTNGGPLVRVTSEILLRVKYDKWSDKKYKELLEPFIPLSQMDSKTKSYQLESNTRLFGCIMRKKRKNKNA